MSTNKDTHLQAVQAIHAELMELLNGMDYCLDWKPDPDAWSVRDVVYHLLDTPSEGIHTILRQVLAGEISEFDLRSDLTNMTMERLSYEMERVVEDVNLLFCGMEAALQASGEGDLLEKSVLVHQRNRGWDEPRTLHNLLEGLFARHWREHLVQVRELREALGM